MTITFSGEPKELVMFMQGVFKDAIGPASVTIPAPSVPTDSTTSAEVSYLSEVYQQFTPPKD